ncbi:MAG: NAD(+)/NADH kinase [Oribacterium sp.]|nr:NAD(+)/NADH kinase [Oribacterium sp.]MDY6317253.1 NAD(+)/NADH kinase [Oribacterium sp.]
MKITLVVNTKKPEAVEYANITEAYLREHGVKVKSIYEETYTRDDFSENDCIITIGGDGTLLRLAGILRGQDTPILGLNAGHLGYLTEASSKEEIPEVLDDLLAHRYTRDVRSMLHGSVTRNGEVIVRGTALNEVLIGRREGITVLYSTVNCNGVELTHYISDGILFATPTGSTAYSLSAGGPIVDPAAPVIIMTPICAHTMNGRSVILQDSSQLSLTIEQDNELIAFDGEQRTALKRGDEIRIRKANEMTTLIKRNKTSFLETLRSKIGSER